MQLMYKYKLQSHNLSLVHGSCQHGSDEQCI